MTKQPSCHKIDKSQIDPVIQPEKTPNHETIKAMGGAREGKTVETKDLQDLWKKLDI